MKWLKWFIEWTRSIDNVCHLYESRGDKIWPRSLISFINIYLLISSNI
jgi:hypothetical protein